MSLRAKLLAGYGVFIAALVMLGALSAWRLARENSFRTAEARSLLSNFLWNERNVPPMRRLVLKNLDPDRLPVAARWRAEGMKNN